MMKSVLGVVAGLVVFSVALFGMDAAATALMIRIAPDTVSNGSALNQNDLARVLWLVWETSSMAGAGYVTAWIASRSAVRNATIMGAIQMAMTIWALVAIRDADQPLWFWLVGIVFMVPAAWYGGWHRARGASHRHDVLPHAVWARR
jgi:hypothetical protein